MLDFRNLRVVIFTFFISLLLYLPAYSQEPPYAYITDFDGDNICKVNLLTNMEEAVIEVCDGCDPYWIAASANQNLVAASLHDDTGVALIDAETMSWIANVACVDISEPEAIAVNSTGTLVYVADELLNTLWVVDVASQTCVEGPINLDPVGPAVDCDNPENMVISPDDSTLYITCDDGDDVVSVDTATLDVDQIADSGEHGIALNPLGTLLYYGDGDTVIEYNTVTGVPTGREYADCVMYNGAISPDGSRLYCVEGDQGAGGDDLFIYDIAVPGGPIDVVDLMDSTARGVAVSKDGARAFVPLNDVLKVVDTVTFNLMPDIDLTCEDARDIVIVQEIPPPPIVTEVPTLSQWGLIAMVGILGIVGFMVMRRRKVSA